MELKKFNPLEAEIAEIKRDCKNLVIADTKTYQGVRKSRTRVQRVISSIEEIRKDLKAPYLEKGRKIDQIARELTSELQPVKAELVDKIAEWDKKKEEERILRAKKEEERVANIKNLIDQWRENARPHELKTVEEVEALKKRIENERLLKKTYQEFLPTIEMDREYFIRECDEQIRRMEEAENRRIVRMYERYKEMTGDDYPGDSTRLELDLVVLEENAKQRALELAAQVEKQPDIKSLYPKTPVEAHQAPAERKAEPIDKQVSTVNEKGEKTITFEEEVPLIQAYIKGLKEAEVNLHPNCKNSEAAEFTMHLRDKIFSMLHAAEEILSE